MCKEVKEIREPLNNLYLVNTYIQNIVQKTMLDKAHLSKEHMSIITLEELSELQQAISKLARGKDTDKTRDNYHEELADVLIGLNMVFLVYGVDIEEVILKVHEKLARMLARADSNCLT